MTTIPRKTKMLRWILFLCVLALIGVSIVLAALHRTPWVVPVADKERKNPLSLTDANIVDAKEIYGNKCADCHGAKGKGDGSEAMMYDPAPSDLTDTAKMSKLTDGEIFYQISEGRKPMPSFKKKLTEEQRWQLVLFVRSLAAAPDNATQAPSGKPN